MSPERRSETIIDGSVPGHAGALPKKLMTLDVKKIAAAALLMFGLGLVYWQVLQKLVYDWGHDDNYSHGYLIVPLALYFAWERRAKLAAAEIRPSWLGLVAFGGGIAVLLVGLLGAELFLSRISLIATLAGAVLFLFGWAHLRVLAFPLAFLLLMIPIPAIIFNQIAFPLQLIASQFGEFAIASAGIPVLREGNVIVLAHTTLEVAEACSGIRSLVSLITLGLIYGYFVGFTLLGSRGDCRLGRAYRDCDQRLPRRGDRHCRAVVWLRRG